MDVHFSWYILPAAFVFDLIFGDSHSFPHPVRWMGKAITIFEPRFRKISANPRACGVLFAAFLILGIWLMTLLVVAAAQGLHPAFRAGVEIILIYFCISVRSLNDAAMEVRQCLLQKNVSQAKKKVALIVGRDIDHYNEAGIARAAVETVAENVVDGVISPLFFAAIGGAPLALAYKMTNTLDSMVGYKNEKYLHFGKASARLDDMLNYIPARLSVPVISLAAQILAGRGACSMETARQEGAHHTSPNAGYPEAAFAGALAVKLNGPNYYNGQLVNKPYIGVRFGETSPEDIKKACDLMMLASLLWLIIAWGTSAAFKLFW